MPEPDTLRVISLGSQAPLRSQTTWHAIAAGVSGGRPPTLSFVRPSAPYVSLGFHRRLDEIDVDACRERGLPVFRRMIGGGPVYLDADQLFFQITVPAPTGAFGGAHLMRRLLEPAAAAFRDCGVDARVDEHGDISVGAAKVSGVGGGQIGRAAIAVGNLIERFDHEAMAAILPADPSVRLEALRLMRAYVEPTPVDPEAFMVALVTRYSAALELQPREGELDTEELEELARLDERFLDPDWVRGSSAGPRPSTLVKIRSGVWLVDAPVDGGRVVASVIDERIERVRVRHPGMNGAAARLERALSGRTVSEAAAAAEPYGEPGRLTVEAIETTMRRAR